MFFASVPIRCLHIYFIRIRCMCVCVCVRFCGRTFSPITLKIVFYICIVCTMLHIHEPKQKLHARRVYINNKLWSLYARTKWTNHAYTLYTRRTQFYFFYDSGGGTAQSHHNLSSETTKILALLCRALRRRAASHTSENASTEKKRKRKLN